MGLPQPTTNPETYLFELTKQINVLNETLEKVVNELQQLNNAATQKPSIQLDVVKLADAITSVIQNQSKPTKSKAG